MTARTLALIMALELVLAVSSLALGATTPAAFLAGSAVVAGSLALMVRYHRGSWSR